MKEKVYEKGWKAFEPGMKCKGKQYAENTVFEEKGNVDICEPGMMHYCEYPFDVWDYYDMINPNGSLTEYAPVEALAEPIKHENKSATKKLRIGAKLNLTGFIQAGIEFLIEKTKPEKIKDSDLSDQGEHSAKIGSSGDSAKIGSSGYYAKIGSSGDSAKIGSSGYSAQIGSSGDSAKIDSSGEDSVIMCAGDESMARAKKGSWITLAEWEYSEEKERYVPVAVKTEQVDGERIKEDTFYRLVNGKFEEVE